MISSARGSRQPMTTRSGRMKSSIAEPSRRNSGLLTTAKGWSPARRATISSIIWPVPIGTVLLVTITL